MNRTLGIKEFDEYYKSGDYPKYIITQISEGTKKYKETKKEYDGIENRIQEDLAGREDPENQYKDFKWKLKSLHDYLDTGEKQLDLVNEHIDMIYNWKNLTKTQRRQFLDAVVDCRDFTEDRWNTKENLIKEIRKYNKELDNGVTDHEYISCTNYLLEPLYKIDNNLQRIQRNYKE